MDGRKNHAIEYGNFGKTKPPQKHFVTDNVQKANRMQRLPKKRQAPKR